MAEEQMLTMACVIPETHLSGNKLTWASPAGQMFELIVPETLKPGETLHFNIPATLINVSNCEISAPARVPFDSEEEPPQPSQPSQRSQPRRQPPSPPPPPLQPPLQPQQQPQQLPRPLQQLAVVVQHQHQLAQQLGQKLAQQPELQPLQQQMMMQMMMQQQMQQQQQMMMQQQMQQQQQMMMQAQAQAQARAQAHAHAHAHAEEEEAQLWAAQRQQLAQQHAALHKAAQQMKAARRQQLAQQKAAQQNLAQQKAAQRQQLAQQAAAQAQVQVVQLKAAAEAARAEEARAEAARAEEVKAAAQAAQARAAKATAAEEEAHATAAIEGLILVPGSGAMGYKGVKETSLGRMRGKPFHATRGIEKKDLGYYDTAAEAALAYARSATPGEQKVIRDRIALKEAAAAKKAKQEAESARHAKIYLMHGEGHSDAAIYEMMNLLRIHEQHMCHEDIGTGDEGCCSCDTCCSCGKCTCKDAVLSLLREKPLAARLLVTSSGTSNGRPQVYCALSHALKVHLDEESLRKIMQANPGAVEEYHSASSSDSPILHTALRHCPSFERLILELLEAAPSMVAKPLGFADELPLHIALAENRKVTESVVKRLIELYPEGAQKRLYRCPPWVSGPERGTGMALHIAVWSKQPDTIIIAVLVANPAAAAIKARSDELPSNEFPLFHCLGEIGDELDIVPSTSVLLALVNAYPEAVTVCSAFGRTRKDGGSMALFLAKDKKVDGSVIRVMQAILASASTQVDSLCVKV